MKVIALLSGGLDSTLAIRLVKDQKIEITALHFTTVFCRCDGKNGCGRSAARVADELNIPIKTINHTAEFLEIIKHPKHGYGKHLNPCIDCRILCLKTAHNYMKEIGARFVITGEVLGQRPMSQHRRALETIEKESGLEGLIVRPLSAQVLPPTIPEKSGWLDRTKLLAFSGRSRRPQMHLAKLFEIKDYPCPAGGCLLTDPSFAERVRDLMKHSTLTTSEAVLLKLGRHFRLDDRTKLVVGRDETDNNSIRALAGPEDVLIDFTAQPGPIGLLRGDTGPGNIDLAVRITARYADHKGTNPIAGLLNINGQSQPITATAFTDQEIKPYLIGPIQSIRIK